MAIAAYPDRQQRYRVRRNWPGGPPIGAEFSPQANRVAYLVRAGFVEVVKPRRKRKSGDASVRVDG